MNLCIAVRIEVKTNPRILNNGRYAYNNLQRFDNTGYHKFNASWHMATEAWYMYQIDVRSVSGPLLPEEGTNGAFCSPGEMRCTAPEWAMVNYAEGARELGC